MALEVDPLHVGESERLGSIGTLRTLFPYLWPRGEWEMRTRVVLALAVVEDLVLHVDQQQRGASRVERPVAPLRQVLGSAFAHGMFRQSSSRNGGRRMPACGRGCAEDNRSTAIAKNRPVGR